MSKQQLSRIGVLTSGGDCAGLNAAIRAVVKRAIHAYDAEVVGILESTNGLLSQPPQTMDLTLRHFNGTLLRSGGTLLGTINKGNPFAYPMPDGSVQDRSAEIIQNIKDLALDGLIGIGGDGSLRILSELMAKTDVPFIGIPKTIDNDVPLTEFAIGFHTSVGVVTEALDRLQPTAASHHRVMILETMGRDAGHIALSAGIAGGADVILIPEIPFEMHHIVSKLHGVLDEESRNHGLIVCAEAARPTSDSESVAAAKDPFGIGHWLGEQVSAQTGAETRVTVLGHVQRGGQPSSFDRVLASSFGVRAVDLLAEGKSGRMVSWWDGHVRDVDIRDVAGQSKPVNPEGFRVATARGLGICMGD